MLAVNFVCEHEAVIGIGPQETGAGSQRLVALGSTIHHRHGGGAEKRKLVTG